MKSQVNVTAREAIMCKNISNEHILKTSRENPRSIAALLAHTHTHTIHYKHTHLTCCKHVHTHKHRGQDSTTHKTYSYRDYSWSCALKSVFILWKHSEMIFYVQMLAKALCPNCLSMALFLLHLYTEIFKRVL